MSDQGPAFDQETFSERVARNEARFREVNEAIGGGRDPGDDRHRVGFVCECALPDCARIIEMTPAEYQELRSHPTHFAVVDGHWIPEAERVVRRAPGYTVVEKLSLGARIARELDPRKDERPPR